MKSILIASLISLLAPLSANAQQAGTLPALSASAAARPPDPNFLDEQTVDFFVPVITMEQFYFLHAKRQGYRIQIFKDGRGIYHGLKSAKTLGEVRFNLRPEQVQEILAEFDRYKFWQVPEDQYGTPRGFGVMPLLFTLRDKGRTKTIRFGGQRQAIALLYAIEKHVQSDQWRCPFVDDDGNDPCERRRRDFREDVSTFLSRDLPKLQEEYK